MKDKNSAKIHTAIQVVGQMICVQAQICFRFLKGEFPASGEQI